MGGVSEGKATLEQDGDILFARLTGKVSTKNNGGFIQIRSRFSLIDFQKNGKKFRGVRLNIRGNGEIYHIFIRTENSQNYRDYYLTTFKSSLNWQLIDLPFSEFKHRVLNNFDLEKKNIQTFGIVAYGREFISDLSVSSLSFYY